MSINNNAIRIIFGQYVEADIKPQESLMQKIKRDNSGGIIHTPCDCISCTRRYVSLEKFKNIGPDKGCCKAMVSNCDLGINGKTNLSCKMYNEMCNIDSKYAKPIISPMEIPKSSKSK